MKSRYENVPTRTLEHRETITSADANINRKIPWDKIRTKIIQYNGVDRMDQLADKYCGHAQYWWVIALANGLWANCWRLEPGARLVVPENIQDVLDYF